MVYFKYYYIKKTKGAKNITNILLIYLARLFIGLKLFLNYYYSKIDYYSIILFTYIN